jgi:hypothetical protein
MSTPESKVKTKVRKILDDLGAYYFFPATGGYGKSGVPDIVGCYQGRFFGIECKAGDNKPTALQMKNLDLIAEKGGVAYIVNESGVGVLRIHMSSGAALPGYRVVNLAFVLDETAKTEDK